jgi:hypothetical protein
MSILTSACFENVKRYKYIDNKDKTTNSAVSGLFSNTLFAKWGMGIF